MLKGAVDHVGNGLEPSVRMPRGPLRLTGPVLHLAHLVHMDERIQVSLIEPIERTPHRKALALYAFWSRSDGEDGPFHRCDRIDVREFRGQVAPLKALYNRSQAGITAYIASDLAHHLTNKPTRVGVVLPKTDDAKKEKHDIMDFAGRGPASNQGSEPYSYLGRDVNLFQRVSERMQEKSRLGSVGI